MWGNGVNGEQDYVFIFEGCEITKYKFNNLKIEALHLLDSFNYNKSSPIIIRGRRCIEQYVFMKLALEIKVPFIIIDNMVNENRFNKILSKIGDSIEVNLVSGKIFESKVTIHNNEDLKLSNDICYVVFTSGTTGEPKGVPITIDSINNSVFQRIKKLELKKEVYIQLFSPNFDGFIITALTLFSIGGKLVIPTEEDIRDAESIKKLIHKHSVTNVLVTPYIAEMISSSSKIRCVKKMSLAGEKVSKNQLIKFSESFVNARFYNEYGPSEDAIVSSISEIINIDKINIGMPLEGKKFILVDENYKLVSENSLGNLAISGIGLTPGYLGNDKLNRESFFYHDENLFYNTGDIAKFNDESFQIIGRQNNETKVRGQRINLEFIDELIQHIEGVDKVLTFIDNEELIACIKCGDSFDIAEFKLNVKNNLPDFMIPREFRVVDEFDYTSNGKIDRKKIPTKFQPLNYNIENSKKNLLTENVIKVILEKIMGKKISSNENLFQLGLSSLKFTSIIFDVVESINVKIEFIDIILNPTISELANFITHKEENVIVKLESGFKNDAILGILTKENEFPGAYNLGFKIKNVEIKHIDTLVEKISKVVLCNPNYKKVWKIEGDLISNYELAENLVYINAIQLENLDDYIHHLNNGFNFGSEYPVRLLVYSEGTNCQVFFLTSHLYIDFYSQKRMIEKIFGVSNNDKINIPNSNYINTNVSEEEIKFWKSKLKVIDFSDSFHKDITVSEKNNKVSIKNEINISENLIHLLNNKNTSFSSFTYSLFSVIVSKLISNDNIIFGVPFSKDMNSDGFSIVTMPVVYKVNNSCKLCDYIESTKHLLYDFYSHSNTSMIDICQKLTKEIDFTKSTIYEYVVNYVEEDEHVKKTYEKNYDVENITSDTPVFDLNFTFKKSNNKLNLTIEYDSGKYAKDYIKSVGDIISDIFESYLEHKDKKIKHISLSEESISDINQTNVLSIHSLLNSAVKYGDNKIAIIDNDEVCTYDNLRRLTDNFKANLNLYCEMGDRIIIHTTKSIRLVALMLACIELGICYIPIDTRLPISRKKFIIEDSSAKLVIGEEKEDFNSEILFFKMSEFDYTLCLNKKVKKINQKLIAYIIYTSGTTGNPKGVMITYRNMSSLFSIEFSDFTDNDKWTFFHSHCFDFSVWEIFQCLKTNAELHIIHDLMTIDQQKFSEYLIEKNITILNHIPTPFYSLSEILMSNSNSLRCIISGGEKLKYNLIENFSNKFPDIKFINMYGITETTVHATIKYVEKSDIANNTSAVGQALENCKFIIVDKDNNLLPNNIPGEICLYGNSITKGYNNNEEMNEQKFFYQNGKKIYKSGDAGYVKSGELNFLGRIDHQVKIRGFRIELGHINSVAEKCDKIAEVVTLKKVVNDEEYLVMYVSFTSEKITWQELKEILRKELIYYMIPDIFIEINSIPKTLIGKIDLKKLSQIDIFEASENFIYPVSIQQKKISAIWCDVLNKREISMDEDFFSLGGHSLKMTVMLSRLNQEIGIDVSVSEFRNNSTIEKLDNIINSMYISNEMCMAPDNFLLLQRGSSTKHIFFIHAGSGIATVYEGIATKFNSEYNVWGINYSRMLPENIEIIEKYTVAKEYFLGIKKIINSDSDKIHICGWCSGGQIAYEVAQMFESDEKKVNLVIFNSEAKNNYNFKTEGEILNRFYDLHPKIYDKNSLFEKCNHLFTVEKLFEYLTELEQTSMYGSSLDTPKSLIKSLFRIYEIQNSLSNWKLKNDKNITSVSVVSSTIDVIDNISLWNRVTSNEIIYINLGHEEMFKEKYDKLYEHIKELY